MSFSPAHRIELEFARSIERAVRDYILRPTESIQDLAELIAQRMVMAVSAANARAWRQAAESRGRRIYSALRRELNSGLGIKVHELVIQNARQISSIPQDIRESLAEEIARLQAKGERPEQIEKIIRRRLPQLSRSKSRLIARTETMKAASALTRARSEDLGIDWFQWETAEDSRVRPSHRLMDRVLVKWTDLPAPERLAGIRSNLGFYAPGGAPNCRCVAIPIISLAQIAWPAAVYHHHAITRMTMAQFAEFSGIRRRAA